MQEKQRQMKQEIERLFNQNLPDVDKLFQIHRFVEDASDDLTNDGMMNDFWQILDLFDIDDHLSNQKKLTCIEAIIQSWH